MFLGWNYDRIEIIMREEAWETYGLIQFYSPFRSDLGWKLWSISFQPFWTERATLLSRLSQLFREVIVRFHEPSYVFESVFRNENFPASQWIAPVLEDLRGWFEIIERAEYTCRSLRRLERNAHYDLSLAKNHDSKY